MNRPPYSTAQDAANWSVAIATRPNVTLAQFCQQRLVADGVKKVFSLYYPPDTNSLNIFTNGLLQHLGDDYALADNIVTFVNAPEIGSILLAQYRRS